MKGLPPVPLDVLEYEEQWDCDGASSSTIHWIFAAGASLAAPSDLETALSAFIFASISSWPTVQHQGCSLSTCRLRIRGPSPLMIEKAVIAGHGLWEGGQANQVAIGVRWLTGQPGRGGVPITHLPGVPDEFIESHVRLTSNAVVNVTNAAATFYNQINAVSIVPPTPCVLGTLHRQAHGVPLGLSQFVPILGGQVIRKVNTIRRRIP